LSRDHAMRNIKSNLKPNRNPNPNDPNFTKSNPIMNQLMHPH